MATLLKQMFVCVCVCVCMRACTCVYVCDTLMYKTCNDRSIVDQGCTHYPSAVYAQFIFILYCAYLIVL